MRHEWEPFRAGFRCLICKMICKHGDDIQGPCEFPKIQHNHHFMLSSHANGNPPTWKCCNCKIEGSDYVALATQECKMQHIITEVDALGKTMYTCTRCGRTDEDSRALLLTYCNPALRGSGTGPNPQNVTKHPKELTPINCGDCGDTGYLGEYNVEFYCHCPVGSKKRQADNNDGIVQLHKSELHAAIVAGGKRISQRERWLNQLKSRPEIVTARDVVALVDRIRMLENELNKRYEQGVAYEVRHDAGNQGSNGQRSDWPLKDNIKASS